MKKIKFIALGILVILFSFWYFYLRTAREHRLMKEGNILVEKIEQYQKENGLLPNSLAEMGIEEQEGIDALYYDKIDSLHYEVSFGMSIDYNRTYSSKTKQWKDLNEVIQNR